MRRLHSGTATQVRPPLPIRGQADPRQLSGLRGVPDRQRALCRRRLDGLACAITYAWPGPIYEGKGEMQVIIDERADRRSAGRTRDRAQGRRDRGGEDALVGIPRHVRPDPSDPVQADRVRVRHRGPNRPRRHPGVLESTGRPISSPVTGEPHRVRIDIPDGIEFKLAEMGSADDKGHRRSVARPRPDTYGSVQPAAPLGYRHDPLSGDAALCRPLRIQLDVPVEIVAPGLVQVVRREGPAVERAAGAPWAPRAWPSGCMPHSCGRRLPLRRLQRVQAVTMLLQEVLPPRERGTTWSKVSSGAACGRRQYWQAKRSRRNTLNRVKGGRRSCGNVLLQRHDAGQPELEARRADHLVVVADHGDAVEEDRLDGVLPAPQRERVVGQGLVVGVEDQGRERGEWLP